MQYAYTTYFVRSEIKINWKCVPSTTTTVHSNCNCNWNRSTVNDRWQSTVVGLWSVSVVCVCGFLHMTYMTCTTVQSTTATRYNWRCLQLSDLWNNASQHIEFKFLFVLGFLSHTCFKQCNAVHLQIIVFVFRRNNMNDWIFNDWFALQQFFQCNVPMP